MTHAQLVKMLIAQVKMVSPDVHDVDDVVNGAISLGITDVWYSFPWTFTCDEKTLTVSSSSESYDLPKDLGAILSVREDGSLRDRSPVYIKKEEFDFRVPRTDVLTTGSPDIWTVFYDNGQYKISFLPQPDAGTVFKIYGQTKPPDTLDGVAPKAHAAVKAACAKHLFPSGTNEYSAAFYQFTKEVQRLQLSDLVNRPAHTQMYIDNLDETRVFRPWANEY